MKRFNFSLEKVLKLRKFREEQTKIELGHAVGILSGIENEIKTNAQARNTAARERFSGVSAVHAGIADLNQAGAALEMFAWDNYIARLDQETENLFKKAAQAELVVEERRTIYLDASRELKVMEKLKEKREKEYRKEYFAAETRELDDLKRRVGQSGEAQHS